MGAEVALLTAKPDSTLGTLADTMIAIGTPAHYGQVVGMPMGTAFERPP